MKANLVTIFSGLLMASRLPLEASGQENIGRNCLKKRPLRGKMSGIEFSDEDQLVAQIGKTMLPYAYYECNDKKKDLKQFQLVLADPEQDNSVETRTIMKIVNPEEAIEWMEELESQEEDGGGEDEDMEGEEEME